MTGRNTSDLVKRTAGDIASMLVSGPVTLWDIEKATGQEQRTIIRAISHIKDWPGFVVLSKRGASETRDSRPMVYSLEDPRVARAAFGAVDIAMRTAPCEAVVAITMHMGGVR